MISKEEKLKEIYNIVENHGITAYQIWQNTGISQAGIGKILNKLSKNPQISTVDKIYNYLISLVNTNNATKTEITLNLNEEDSVYIPTKNASLSSENEIEVFVNKNGNTYYVKEDGSTDIEVVNIPFNAYASYLEVFTDERQVLKDFDKVRFSVDQIGRGYYISFDILGDSMNGGSIDDTPDKSKVLARELGRHLWKSPFRKEKYGYILMTKQNIYFKDIVDYNESTGELTLHSRNPMENDFKISINDVYRIFNVIKRTF